MRTVIGSDHAGFELKTTLARSLRDLGDDVLDVGTSSTNPVGYPDFAEAVGKAVLDGWAERGVLICASVAANKLRGIRAGFCHDSYSAHQGVEHDDMHVLGVGIARNGSHVGRRVRARIRRREIYSRRAPRPPLE